MIFFENNKVDLLKYLPFFMQEYCEIKNIMETENPEFELFWVKLREVFGNQFIEYCNEEGISKFEKMLNIYSYENDTLEMRIFRVLTYWNARVPFTWKVLINKMNQLCESPKNYELNLDNNNYTLNVTTKFDDEKKYDELNTMLKVIIPANLGINSINVLMPKVEKTIYINAALIVNQKYKIDAFLPDTIFNLDIKTSIAFNKKYKIGG